MSVVWLQFQSKITNLRLLVTLYKSQFCLGKMIVIQKFYQQDDFSQLCDILCP